MQNSRGRGFSQAMVVFAALCAGTGSCFASSYEEGLNLYNKGRFEDASRHLEEVVTHDPLHVEATYLLANSRAHLGDHPRAARLYKVVLAIGRSTQAAGHATAALTRYEQIDRLRLHVRARRPQQLGNARDAIRSHVVEKTSDLDLRHGHNLNNAERHAGAESARVKEFADAAVAELEAARTVRIRGRSSRSSSSRGIEAQIADIRAWEAERKASIDLAHQENRRRQMEHSARQYDLLTQCGENLEELLADQSSSGVKLNPAGTNLYVRNYVVNSPRILD